MKILVCSNHNLTKEQVADLNLVATYHNHEGRVDYLTNVNPELGGKLKNVSPREAWVLAQRLLTTISIGGYKGVFLPIGSPSFMTILTPSLTKEGIIQMFSETERVSVDETLPDGSVKKTAVFKHQGLTLLVPTKGLGGKTLLVQKYLEHGEKFPWRVLTQHELENK